MQLFVFLIYIIDMDSKPSLVHVLNFKGKMQTKINVCYSFGKRFGGEGEGALREHGRHE